MTNIYICHRLKKMTIQLPHTEPWQRDLLDAYLVCPKDRWFIINSIRQIGKSTIAQLLLIYVSLSKNASVSLCVSPVISQARKMFEDVNRMASKIIVKSNGSTLEIMFVNGSKILFRSAEQKDSLRGYTVKGAGILVVDEAAYIQDDLFFRILVPTTNVNRSDIFVFSTPKFKSGFFYELYTKGLMMEDGRIKSFDWTRYDTSKYLTPDILELYRQQMPKSAFESEYLGQFIDADGSVFSDFKKCIKETTIDYSYPIYITIDWSTGQGGDSTAITIGQLIDNHINIYKSIAFNDKNVEQTINYIIGLMRSFATAGSREFYLLVEKNSIGNIWYQVLNDNIDKFEADWNNNVSYKDEISVSASMFLTTNKSKERIVKQLITCFENNLISIPDDKKLILELNTFECKISSLGNPIYAASGAFHDDRVMSLCFMMDLLYNELNTETSR